MSPLDSRTQAFRLRAFAVEWDVARRLTSPRNTAGTRGDRVCRRRPGGDPAAGCVQPCRSGHAAGRQRDNHVHTNPKRPRHHGPVRTARPARRHGRRAGRRRAASIRRYGILVWTVTGAVITNQDPKAFVAGEAGKPVAASSLILDLDLRNDNLSVGIVQATARFILSLPGGATVTGEAIGRSGVPPLSTGEGRYAFEVPDGTTFDGLSISIADPGREPSVDLPLSGDAPALVQYTTFKPGTSTKIPIPKVAMTWAIEELHIGPEWSLPVGFKGGTLPADARAAAGEVWVGIMARVQTGTCDCPGGVLDQAGNVRLVVDGVPISSTADASTKAIVNAQEVSEVLLVFAVPASATTATLQIGPLDKPAQQSTIVLQLRAAG